MKIEPFKEINSPDKFSTPIINDYWDERDPFYVNDSTTIFSSDMNEILLVHLSWLFYLLYNIRLDIS